MSTTKCTLLPKVQKRILNDVSELNKNYEELMESGIYWYVNDENIQKIWVVITGQEGTPYEDVPFFFEFTYTENFPLMPPTGKFCTSDGKTRFNPNLYVDGKICLSILGTWSGPSWTPVMTTKTILMSIIALVMTNEPVKNEPGWEKASKEDVDSYNLVVEYRSLQVGIIDQINNCPELFKPLLPQILARFRRDFQKIMDRVNRNIALHDGKEVRPRYGSAWKLNYTDLKKQMMELGKKYCEIIDVPALPPVQLEVTPVVEQSSSPQKRPNESASVFDIDHIETIDGVEFKVMVNKNGKKYWRKL